MKTLVRIKYKYKIKNEIAKIAIISEVIKQIKENYRNDIDLLKSESCKKLVNESGMSDRPSTKYWWVKDLNSNFHH